MARRSPGVRARTTLVATGVVTVAIVAALIAIGFVTYAGLNSGIEDRATSRAESLAGLVEAGAAVDPLPGRNPELLAQVIAADGSVVAADRAAAGLAPFTSLRPSSGATTLVRVPAPAGIIDDDGLPEQGTWVLAIRGAATGDIVVVGTPLDDMGDVLGAAAAVAGLGALAVIGVVAAITWLLTGRALRPVESMRAEAAQISAGRLDRRLAVPASGDEIARLATTLNDMLQRLEEAAESRRVFVADASHELRSPVAAMRAMIDVSAGDVPDPGLLGALEAEVTRLERLVADLLALARSDRTPRPRLAEVDMDQILREEADAMRRRSAQLVDTSGIAASRVVADPDAMARLVRNLGDNALRHARTQVWLTSRTADGRVIVGIDDDGPGVAPPDRERIFERLVRLDASRDRASGGSGLGLSVVRAIAREAGGEVRFVEPRHGGASVEVWLPAAPD